MSYEENFLQMAPSITFFGAERPRRALSEGELGIPRSAKSEMCTHNEIERPKWKIPRTAAMEPLTWRLIFFLNFGFHL